MAEKQRLTAAEREERNRRILNLFIVGRSGHDIAKLPGINLTPQRVNKIIAEELDRTTRDQTIFSEKAMTLWMARQEHLTRRAFEHVDDGELKAIEVARRLQGDMAKMFQLIDIAPVPAAPPPMSDTELDDGDQLDELSRYRAQRDLPKARASSD